MAGTRRGRLLDGDPPKPGRYVFTDDRARDTSPAWGRVADERAAELEQGPFRAGPRRPTSSP